MGQVGMQLARRRRWLAVRWSAGDGVVRDRTESIYVGPDRVCIAVFDLFRGRVRGLSVVLRERCFDPPTDPNVGRLAVP